MAVVGGIYLGTSTTWWKVGTKALRSSKRLIYDH